MTKSDIGKDEENNSIMQNIDTVSLPNQKANYH